MPYFSTSYASQNFRGRSRFLCLVFFLFLIPSFLFSQQPALQFRHINNEEGLSNSTIESICQDSRGFLWFGTRNGLNRYDGLSMTVFKNNPSDTNSLGDNYIRNIYEDNHHQLWIATYNGLDRYETATNHFIHYRHNPQNSKSLSGNRVTSVYGDKQGALWVSTDGNGLNLLNNDGSFTRFLHSAVQAGSISDNRVNCMYEDKSGYFWIGTENGLNLFNRQNGSFYLFTDSSNNERIGDNNKIRHIQEDGQGNLWLATESRGLLNFDAHTKTFQQLEHNDADNGSLSSNLVRAIMVDTKGRLWVGSINGGLDLYNSSTASFYHYQNAPEDAESLSQRTISALLEDRQGNLWVGTHRSGINFYSPTAQKFNRYRQGTSPSTLSYSDTKTFYEDKAGNFWVGTDGGGLDLFNRNTNTFQHYQYSAQKENSLGSDAVLHVMEDSRNNLWISTWGGGLNLMNRAAGTFTRFKNNPADSTSLSSDFVQKVFEDKDNHLWIATYYGGLNLFDPKTQTFSRFIAGKGKENKLSGNDMISMDQDKEGNLWIGTDDGGLNDYNPATGKILHYFTTGEKYPDLRVLFFDHKGRLWVGQTGLYLFDAKTKSFRLYTKKAGLDKLFIKGMEEDDTGNFWISTSNGLVRFNPDNGDNKTFNTGDGLQGLEFEANAYYKAKNGEMFFGGTNGFNRFFPQNISNNPFVPPVYITGFQIFNQKMLPGEEGSPLEQDISVTKEIHLSYRQSSLSFNFAALNYTIPENNQYQYKLENFDKAWTLAGNERKAVYTNLSPGEYVFRVKASNNDGIWNEKVASVNIIITPPFWDTWWFRILVAAGLFSAVYFILLEKRRREIKQIEEKKREEMHQVQLQFFTNISHEFRTPLTLISNPLEKLIKEDKSGNFTHYYQLMYRNAQRLLSLINELMDFRKAEAGVLTLKVMPGNLSLFLKEIAGEFTDIAWQKNIRFTIDIPEIKEEVWFDRQVLEKIILNILNNAFKYTPDEGNISIDLLQSMDEFKSQFANELMIKNEYRGKKYVYIRVTDNGIGISKESIKHLFERYYRISESHLGSGVGLAFVKSLTALHKGDILVYSERKEGTEIIIALPVDKQDYTSKEKWLGDTRSNHIKLESVVQEASPEPLKRKGILKQDIEEKTGILQSTHHLLVVDDNEELRSFLKETLSPYYDIAEAGNGEEGWLKAKEEIPDLIISDVMMPVMDGNEFCKRIKEDIETSHIPFVMLTAKSALSANIEGIESGADFYFAKPLNTDLLLLTIRNLFDQRKKLKERFSKDSFAEAKDLVHSSKDKVFMEDLLTIIEDQLVNPDLDIDYLCSEVGMSRTKLYQKIKSITGQSIGEFVRTIRLKRAAYIMTHEDIALSDVMFRIGIQTQSYFTKAFKKEFGKTPTQFMQELKQ